MTRSEIARPRTFSASAQNMRPPSSGSNGNRLMMPSDSEISARMLTARTVSNSKLCRVRLVGADHAGDLVARLGLVDELDDARDRGRGDVPHAGDAERGGLPHADVDAARAEAEADQQSLGLRVVARRDLQRALHAVAQHDDLHGFVAAQPSSTLSGAAVAGDRGRIASTRFSPVSTEMPGAKPASPSTNRSDRRRATAPAPGRPSRRARRSARRAASAARRTAPRG